MDETTSPVAATALENATIHETHNAHVPHPIPILKHDPHAANSPFVIATGTSSKHKVKPICSNDARSLTFTFTSSRGNLDVPINDNLLPTGTDSSSASVRNKFRKYFPCCLSESVILKA